MSLNLSSLAGLVAIPYQAFYCASKHAIEAYTEALRMEMKPFGVHVSMIEPGDFATSFTDNRQHGRGLCRKARHITAAVVPRSRACRRTSASSRT